MKIEEAIEWMEETIQDINELFDQCSTALQEEITEQKEVFELALTALRSMLEAGEPLSLEQLKQMDGKPVWCEDVERWAIVSVSDAGKWKDVPFALFEKNGGRFEWNVEDRELSLYSYPPAHIDRSKWEPCEHCKPSDYPPDRWGAHEFPVVGNEIYFYDTEYGWEGEEIKYCPWCGRPLTEEAWAELERRLRG
nr:MAG TPA: Rad50 zinc hook motif [Caudoviricetes sp.]